MADNFSIKRQNGNAVTEYSPFVHRMKLIKDIVHQASNQLAVVGVIRNPNIVFSGVHAKLQICFTKAPTRSTVVLLEGEKKPLKHTTWF